MIVRGIERCLYLYPENEWFNVENILNKANNFTRAGRLAKRNFLRFAEDAQLDRQNRISIPNEHCTFAEISTKAIFIGMGQYIEIWSPHKLKESDDGLEDGAFEEIFESVMGGGPTSENE